MARTRIILIVGSGRNVGKTLLGEHIVSLLAKRGLRVCTVKHVHHGVDYRVKDTGRYLAAGAYRVYAVASSELMLVERRSVDLLSLLGQLAESDCDIIVVEGFRSIIREAKRRFNGGVYIVCIDLHNDSCDLSIEPGFDAPRVATRILEQLGL